MRERRYGDGSRSGRLSVPKHCPRARQLAETQVGSVALGAPDRTGADVRSGSDREFRILAGELFEEPIIFIGDDRRQILVHLYGVLGGE